MISRGSCVYKPKLTMLMASAIHGCTPALLSVAGAYFLRARSGWWIWIPAGIGLVMSLYLLTVALTTYLTRVTLFEEGIMIRGPLGTTAIPWEAIGSVALRERKNLVTRTDRMLLFKLRNGQTASCCPSALSRTEEADLLERLRQRFAFTVFHDKPTF